jgi:Flagellar assembly protein T, C-terminal domain
MAGICYALRPMAMPVLMRLGAGGVLCMVLLTGCASVGELLGMPSKGDPSVEIKASGPRWLLIKNPRFGDVASEPEYIWVEEDKVPVSMRTLVLGKSSIMAPPEIVAKYGQPPGGGQISPLQRVAQNVASPPEAPAARGAGTGAGAPPPNGGAAAVTGTPKGLVVYVDTDRIVIDLTARDGVKLGSTVSLRRDTIPIVHPVTGEVLGELDQEVATGKVTEVRDRFSVVEIQSVSPGAEIKVKDRVIVR